MKKTTGAFAVVGTGVGETRGGASCFQVATVHAVIASTGRWISRTTDGERKFAEFDRPPIDLAVEQKASKLPRRTSSRRVSRVEVRIFTKKLARG